MLKNGLKRNAMSQPDRPRPANGSFIELRRVVKKYTGTAGSVTALNGVDLQIGAGEFVVVSDEVIVGVKERQSLPF